RDFRTRSPVWRKAGKPLRRQRVRRSRRVAADVPVEDIRLIFITNALRHHSPCSRQENGRASVNAAPVFCRRACIVMTAMPFRTADPSDDVIPITAFSHAVECIYDCALDPARWPQAIREVCAVARCMAGVISVTDLITSAAHFEQSWGFQPASLERMLRYAPD